MSALNGQDVVQEALLASLQAALPHRQVQRSLIDPLQTSNEAMRKGIVCVITEGGGGFANYRGREGDLGTTNVRLVCFVLVEDGEGAEPADVERAELRLLRELLNWVQDPGDRALLGPVDAIYPGDWAGSRQSQYPHGWLLLSLEVR